MARTQENKDVAIETPLGTDVLLLKNMSMSEQLGRPFQMQLNLISETLDIKAEDIVGQNITVRLNVLNGETRYFNGYVSRFVQTPSTSEEASYQATVVPWLWLLTRTADCRIFQEMKAPDIIKKVFKDHGFTDFEEKLTGSYRTWDYCVQYRETDFNFVSRLMEQEGIYYFFKHENGKHTLVMADSISSHEPFKNYEEIKYRPFLAEEDEEVIKAWTTETGIQPGSYSMTDFDFENTKKDLQARSAIEQKHEQSKFDIFDYPGEYTETADGENYARIRIEELQSQYEVSSAVSDVRGAGAGYTFNLIECPRADQNKEYLIIGTSIQIDAGSYESGSQGDTAFSCNFSAIDIKQAFRSLRTTPKPSISGPQTAIVVGPSGEEIHTDKYGRVKVLFHWDRYAKADDKSSCWIRVAQVWAGKKWGAMYIPRIGQEVIVEFLEGDPDKPVITGRIYNASNMPPYDLPAEKTKSTLKSNSSKGGDGFNEIRFEDKKDKEQIFIHAEKNLDIRIKNDRYETVENDRNLHVENDKFEIVDNNRNEEVGADHKEDIGKDRHLKVKGKEAKAVDKSLSLTVKGDVSEVFKKNHSEQVTKDYYLKAKNIVIEGMSNITLNVGGSYIAIEQGSIEIKTSGQLKIEGMTVDVKAQTKASVQGSAMTEVKGGIVKIN